jgi:RNA polymerase sigma-70 factor, ECF subfamily
MITRTAGSSAELMARARSGQAEALGDLCDRYRNYLRKAVHAGMGQRLRERVEPEDVVQEAYVEVVRQFPRFTGQSETDLLGWMQRLVGQKLADLGRYYGRVKRGAEYRALSLHASGDGDGSPGRFGGPAGESRLVEILALSQASPSEEASRREQVVLLAESLAALPGEEAEILWLHYAEGLNFEEIGRRMGCGRKAIRTRWARGLQALRRNLGGPPGGALRFEGLPPARLA